MNYLMALFVLSLALQPMQLRACAMDTQEPQGHHAAMDTPHESNCCESPADHRMDDCDALMTCSFASLLVPVIPVSSGIMLVHMEREFDILAGSHYTEPPFQLLLRPPIA